MQRRKFIKQSSLTVIGLGMFGSLLSNNKKAGAGLSVNGQRIESRIFELAKFGIDEKIKFFGFVNRKLSVKLLEFYIIFFTLYTINNYYEKILLTLIIIISVNAVVSAQMRFGVKGGLNLANVSTNDKTVTPSSALGFHGGIVLDAPLVGFSVTKFFGER